MHILANTGIAQQISAAVQIRTCEPMFTPAPMDVSYTMMPPALLGTVDDPSTMVAPRAKTILLNTMVKSAVPNRLPANAPA
ncbi:MAG: hypothetical protein ACI855_002551 [Myxococcota bacterium]|jgi:hypothetical protein